LPSKPASRRLIGFGFWLILVSCSSVPGPADFTWIGDQPPLTREDEQEKREFIESLPTPQRKFGAPRPFSLIWPVDRAELSQEFRPFRNPSHEGIDLRGRRSTPIRAAHDGWVRYRGNRYSGYGHMVILEHSDQWATLYAHLHKIGVRPGQFVRQGEVIGTMGRSGRATGVHLHFEVLENKIPVDPLDHLP
jgi:murein DD-endopeptidase MepM/ murein hydrolase activator NlpD